MRIHTKDLRILIGLIFFILFSPITANAAEPFMLISEQEYQAQLNHYRDSILKPAIKTRSIFGTENMNNPIIVINSPSVTTGLRAPLHIDIIFKVNEDAIINAESLKVLYGWLKLDITDRIKKHATISLSGLSADNIDLPTGNHTITIEISDSKYRTTEKEVTFEVLEP